MLTFFPAPYPDEILYSVLARYALRVGYTSPKMVLKDLYGSTTVSAVIDLPSYLDGLIERMPIHAKYTSESLIYGNTLFPFYAMFLPEQRAKRIIQEMKGEFGGNLHTISGIMASSIPDPPYLRFCTKCNDEDFQRYGELYWHRLYQIPGVMVCPLHEVPLQNSTVPYRGHNKHEYIPALPENCSNSTELTFEDKRTKEILAEIAQECNWILTRQHGYPSLCSRDSYIGLLADRGLTTPKGFIHQQVFIKEFKTFYSEGLLQLLYCGVSNESESIWLKEIVRKHRKAFHPIRHILMMKFLAGTVERFFTISHGFEPFGNGPWPCLNKASEHYMQPVIDKVIVSTGSKTRKPVGTFMCSCGFEYSRTGPDQEDSDRFRVGRIKKFGVIWEDKLRGTLAFNLSLRDTARQMGCDPKTIVRVALKLGLVVKWETGTDNQLAQESIEINKWKKYIIDQHKEAWLRLIANNRDMGITKLRKISPNSYSWLYRYDKKWLFENSPRTKCRRDSNNPKVNWGKRDKEILGNAKEAVQILLNLSGKPIRVSIGRIGLMIRKKALLEKHLEKLPMTKEYLLSVVENREQFQHRRIKWAAQYLNSRGVNIKPWKLIRTAGIRSEYTGKLLSEIDSQVMRYTPSIQNKRAGR